MMESLKLLVFIKKMNVLNIIFNELNNKLYIWMDGFITQINL